MNLERLNNKTNIISIDKINDYLNVNFEKMIDKIEDSHLIDDFYRKKQNLDHKRKVSNLNQCLDNFRNSTLIRKDGSSKPTNSVEIIKDRALLCLESGKKSKRIFGKNLLNLTINDSSKFIL
jgi:hypothetical protein